MLRLQLVCTGNMSETITSLVGHATRLARFAAEAGCGTAASDVGLTDALAPVDVAALSPDDTPRQTFLELACALLKVWCHASVTSY